MGVSGRLDDCLVLFPGDHVYKLLFLDGCDHDSPTSWVDRHMLTRHNPSASTFPKSLLMRLDKLMPFRHILQYNNLPRIRAKDNPIFIRAMDPKDNNRANNTEKFLNRQKLQFSPKK